MKFLQIIHTVIKVVDTVATYAKPVLTAVAEFVEKINDAKAGKPEGR